MRKLLFLLAVWMCLDSAYSQGQRRSILLEKAPLGDLYEWYRSSSISKKNRVLEGLEWEVANRPNIEKKVALNLLRGKTAINSGDYLLARSEFEKGIKLYEGQEIKISVSPIRREPSKTILNVYDELGYLLLDLNKLDEAEKVFSRSSTERKKHYRKGSLYLISPRQGKAEVLMAKQDFDAAIPILKEIISDLLTTTKTSVRTASFFSSAYGALSTCFLQKGDLKAALRSAKIAERQFGTITGNTDQIALINARIMLVRIYLEMSDLDNAEKWLSKSFETFEEYFTTDIKEYSDLLQIKSELQLKKDLLTESYGTASEMINGALEFLTNNFNNLSEREKQQFFISVSSKLDWYYSLAISLYNETRDSDVLREILETRMQTKGFLLTDQTRIRNQVLASGDRNLIRLMENWQEAKEELAYSLYNGKNNYTSDSLRQAITIYERELSAKTKLTFKRDEIEKNLLPIIQNRLGDGEVAIELIRFKKFKEGVVGLAALGITKHNLSLTFSELSPDDERKIVQFYRNAIQFNLKDTRTYGAIWSEIDQLIATNSKVYFSGDGIFHQINVNTIFDADKGEYMIDRYQILNLSNLKDLLKPAVIYEESVANVFGRPQYDYTEELASIFDADESLVRSNLFDQFESFQEQEFADLFGTEREVRTIKEVLENKDWEVKQYLGAQATEQAIKNIDATKILHIATHGFFMESQALVNPMVKSGLVMAGVNNEGKAKDDGVLTAYEATNLNLDQTWLVVLSACETGLGDVQNGEGVYGLQRALTVAGSANILMSLWKVDDEATKALMTDFYDRVAGGQSIGEAFRMTQLAFKKQNPNPRLWGPFIHVQAKF